jgi:protein tyrosine/serine phosphatase
MLKLIKKIFIGFVVFILFAVAYIHIYGNFHKIDDDVYRSGQLNSYNLSFYLNQFEIKTVLNLRGESKKEWFLNEKNILDEHNVSMLNFGMSNRNFYDYNKTSHIVNLIKNAKKPLLIHCNGGADRTSLASALYQYAIKNKTKEEAKKEMAWFYGHLPSIRPYVIAMDKSFDNYVDKKENE